ncbi:MAG: urease accessory UreF family protein [Chthoniobacterales bacterium]
MISEIQHPDELRHGLGPIWAAARVANPDFAICGPVTFRTTAAFATDAEAWRKTIFEPVLLPALRATLTHARRGELREICAVDVRLTDHLAAPAGGNSRRAGRRLAQLGSELRGDRLLPRLADAAANGSTPGHLAIVFAARCAAFSLHDRVAIGAYLFQEICGGAPAAPVVEVCDFVADCIEEGPSLELEAA